MTVVSLVIDLLQLGVLVAIWVVAKAVFYQLEERD